MGASRKFFDIILEGSESEVLKQVVQHLLARISYLRRRAISAPGCRMEAGESEIDALLKAIEGRDPDAAVSALNAHIRNSVNAAVEYLINEQREGKTAKQAATAGA